MILEKIVDFFWYYIMNLRKYEKKLLKYQGYGNRTIIAFRRENNLEWNTINKILKKLVIIDGLELRNRLRELYQENKELFDDPKTYISHFGPVGKSGGFILNQFSHCFPGKVTQLIDSTEVSKLTDNSNVIFLDDFIGTGQQGIDFIKVLGYSLNSSTKPYLFAICGTQKGIKKINDYNSKFKVKTSLIFDKPDDFLLEKDSQTLTATEKKTIRDFHSLIGFEQNNKYHLGLPLAFFYSTPDNSLGILWNDKNPYELNGIKKEWYGLIPRKY